MPSTTRILALVLVGYVLPLLSASAHAQGNPACTLLTLEEIRSTSGQNYDDASPGDELGQGIGGERRASGAARASCLVKARRC